MAIIVFRALGKPVSKQLQPSCTQLKETTYQAMEAIRPIPVVDHEVVGTLLVIYRIDKPAAIPDDGSHTILDPTTT